MTQQQAKDAANVIMQAGMTDALRHALELALANGLATACVEITGSNTAVTVTLTRATTDTVQRALANAHPVQIQEAIDE